MKRLIVLFAVNALLVPAFFMTDNAREYRVSGQKRAEHPSHGTFEHAKYGTLRLKIINY